MSDGDPSALAAVRDLARSHWLLLAILAGGAVVTFATLASQGFWFDESLTIQVISQSPGDLLDRIADGDPVG